VLGGIKRAETDSLRCNFVLVGVPLTPAIKVHHHAKSNYAKNQFPLGIAAGTTWLDHKIMHPHDSTHMPIFCSESMFVRGVQQSKKNIEQKT
jgi:hypothetical protein